MTTAREREHARRAARGTSSARLIAAREKRIAEGKGTAEDDDWEATGTAFERKLRAEAAKKDAAAKKAAKEQRDAGVREGKKAAAKRTTTKKAATTKAKRTAKRAPVLVRSARTGSLVGIFVASIALVGLYAFLRGAREVPGFLHGIQRGIEWLASPTGVIPFKEGTPK